MFLYKYRQDQEVMFSLKVEDGKVLSGVGTVVGVSLMSLPILGVTYIVSPLRFTGDVELPSQSYPFKIIAIPEDFITEIQEVTKVRPNPFKVVQ